MRSVPQHLLKSGTVEVGAGRAVVDVGVIDADLRILLQILSNNHLLRVDGFAMGILALHGETDINGGVKGHVNFGCSHDRSCLSLFGHFFLLLRLHDKTGHLDNLQRPFILMLAQRVTLYCP